MRLILICLLFSQLAFAQSREEAQSLLDQYQDTSGLEKRLEQFSRHFLGLPYGVGGPLGEGENGRYDQDPLYRFDTFDCTTFVETIMSLALSRGTAEFEQQLDEIRYENGDIDYLKRNHFPSLQWIPNNIKNGYLREINDLILPKNAQLTAEAIINLPGWLKSIKLEEIRVPMATTMERQSLLFELQSQSVNFEPITARMQYLPISTLIKRPELLKKIPHGSIVNFVRPNWNLTDVIGTHMNVSHQGFVFQTSRGAILRHASSGSEKKVIDNDLLEYLRRFENHATLKGIHLMQVVR